MVAENTFRPPWYHKNIMSELMGNIYGQYDAKPRLCSRWCELQHDAAAWSRPGAFEGASNSNLGPEKLENTMSFMFETRYSI